MRFWVHVAEESVQSLVAHGKQAGSQISAQTLSYQAFGGNYLFQDLWKPVEGVLAQVHSKLWIRQHIFIRHLQA